MTAQHYRSASKTPAEVAEIIESRRAQSSPNTSSDYSLNMQVLPPIEQQTQLKVRVYDQLIAPPRGTWNLLEKSKVADYSTFHGIKRNQDLSLADIVGFLIEQRGIAPSAAGYVVEVACAYQPALEKNLSGLLTMCGSLRPEDCLHEFFGRGIDCTRYE